MSIRALEQAAGVFVAQTPDADQSLALSAAVGIALAMATTMGGLEDKEHASLTRNELIDCISNKKDIYAQISRCNDVCLLCVDTAVRSFTKAFMYRVEIARGNVSALQFGSQLDPATIAAVELLVPEFRLALVG